MPGPTGPSGDPGPTGPSGDPGPTGPAGIPNFTIDSSYSTGTLAYYHTGTNIIPAPRLVYEPTSGVLTIGSTSTFANGLKILNSVSQGAGSIEIAQYHNQVDSNNVVFFRARGTVDTPEPVLVGDEIGEMQWQTIDAYGNLRAGAQLTVVADQVLNTGNPGNTPMTFRFTTHNGTTFITRLAISSTGTLFFNRIAALASADIPETINVHSHLVPEHNNTYDLGSTSSQWRSLYVSTSTIYLGGNALSVSGGDLTLNGSTIQGGGATLGDRLTSSTFNVVLEGTTGTVSVPTAIISQGYQLVLAGSQYSYDIGRYLRVRDGDFPSHLHLDTADNTVYDIYLGDDGKYVKVEKDGNVVIGNNNNANMWTFDTAGSITFPDSTVQTTAWTGAGVPAAADRITTGSNSVIIDASGNLTLPTTSTIVATEGQSLTLKSYYNGAYNFFASDYGDLALNNYNDRAACSIYDSLGNLYVLGTVDTDPGNAGERMVLIKYSSAGDVLWSHSFVGDNSGYAPYQMIGESMAFDARGRLHILASSEGSWFTVMRVDVTGNPVLQKRGDINLGLQVTDLSIDSLGNVYILGDETVVYTQGSNPSFIMKLDSNFDLVWVKTIGTGSPISDNLQGQGHGSILVKNDIIYATGGVNTGPDWMWTVKMQTNGTVDWLNEGTYSTEFYTGLVGEGITVDNDGSVYVAAISNTTDGSSTLIKYDSNGNWLWGTKYNGFIGGGDIDVNWHNGFLYTSGAVHTTDENGPRQGFPGALHWAKINATTGEIVYQKVFGAPPVGGEDVWQYRGHDLGDVFNDRLSIAAFTYNSTASTMSNMLILQVPIDGSNTGTYGSYTYGDWTEAGVVLVGGTYLPIPPTTSSFLTTGSGVTVVSTSSYSGPGVASVTATTFLVVNTYTNYTTTISTGTSTITSTSTWSFGVTGDLTFPDGTISSGATLATPAGESFIVQVTSGALASPSNYVSNFRFSPDSGLVFPDNTAQSTAFRFVSPPTESTSTGVAGALAYNENFMYVCTATNSWQRIAWDNTPW